MDIYLKNNPVKLHPDLIRKDGALGSFEHGRPNKKIPPIENNGSEAARKANYRYICVSKKGPRHYRL